MTDNTRRHVERYERFAMRRYPLGTALAELISWHHCVCASCGARGGGAAQMRRTIHALMTGNVARMTDHAFTMATNVLARRQDERARRKNNRAILGTSGVATTTTAQVLAEAAR